MSTTTKPNYMKKKHQQSKLGFSGSLPSGPAATTTTSCPSPNQNRMPCHLSEKKECH